ADYWGVLSVPTTFIIDRRGRPRRVNHGVASAEKLFKQIEDVDRDTDLIQAVISAWRKLQEIASR
ncbi:MAG TPA: hypothetical protein VI755_15570, partial [Anaerolineales bacterium]|nr:hypothetical protein [Anaerolineales bacterium]